MTNNCHLNVQQTLVGVDPDPGRAGTSPGKPGKDAVNLRVDVGDPAASTAAAVNVDDDDRGVLGMGQGNVLHAVQGGMADPVHLSSARSGPRRSFATRP